MNVRHLLSVTSLLIMELSFSKITPYLSANAQEVIHLTKEKSKQPIIAIGDLHADLKSAQRAFYIAGVTDQEGHWILRNTIVVQTGDLTDRGPDGEPLLKWIRSLEAQAIAHHSQFIVLLGNHEVMNLHGDWRYVSQKDIQGFGGLAARELSFSLQRKGEWASWLIGKSAVVQLGDTVFVHGGVSERFAAPADQISRKISEAIHAQPDHPLLGSLGPLWYRGYWLKTEKDACQEARSVLKVMGAKRMVMGHTTRQDGRIASRCNGIIFAIDTGISSVYGGYPAALKITRDKVFAIYEGEQVQLSPQNKY